VDELATSSTLEVKMKIGEFSKRLGLAAATVRFYESVGLIAPAPRVSGSRRYDEAALDRLRVVLALKRAGLTLVEIKELLSAMERDRAPECWQEAARAKSAELDRTIAELRSVQMILENSFECRCHGHADRCALVSNGS
jgi:MerR family copper efflux transcriptional regulator